MSGTFSSGASAPLFGSDPLVLTTGRFEPGQADDFCRSIPDGERRRFALAELAYYRGDAKTALTEFRALTGLDREDVFPAAALGVALTSLAGGDLKDVTRIYEFAKTADVAFEGSPDLTKVSSALLLYFNLLLRNIPAISLPDFGPDAFSMPESIRPMAIYIYTDFLVEMGQLGRAVGLAEGALVFMDRPRPVAEIYLALVICRGYMHRREWDKAEFYFHYAWERAKPDGLYMPFAEHRGMLSGMLEKCLRYREPQAYKRILELSNVYHKRWVHVHNELTGDKLSDALTAIEYNVASLASHGMSNAEIADFLGITVNSVRAHLRNIFNKLGIGNRKELEKYVI